jgi:hypothetical protein
MPPRQLGVGDQEAGSSHGRQKLCLRYGLGRSGHFYSLRKIMQERTSSSRKLPHLQELSRIYR